MPIDKPNNSLYSSFLMGVNARNSLNKNDLPSISGKLGGHNFSFASPDITPLVNLFPSDEISHPQSLPEGRDVQKKELSELENDAAKSNEVFHETVEISTPEELNHLEDEMINAFDAAESSIDKWQSENLIGSIEKHDINTNFEFDDPVALQEKWQAEDLVSSIENHDLRSDFVFDEPSVPNSDNRNSKINYGNEMDFVIDEPSVPKPDKRNSKINHDNEAVYLKFDRLLNDIEKSDKNKLMMSSKGELYIKKRSFLSRFKEFFSRGKSKQTQNALKSVLTAIHEDLKNGNFQYRNAEGEIIDLTKLANSFVNTKYGKGVLFHNENLKSLSSEIATMSKLLKINDIKSYINVDKEVELYEPSEKVEKLLSEMLDTEKTYNERVGTPIKIQWELRDGSRGNFFDLLLDRGLMSQDQHEILMKVYSNAHQKVRDFLRSLDAGRHRTGYESFKLYLNAIQPKNMQDYLESMVQVESIYTNTVLPLIKSLSNNEILVEYRKLTGNSFASDLITPIQRGPRHGLFFNEIAKDQSLSSPENLRILEAIGNSTNYIKEYLS